MEQSLFDFVFFKFDMLAYHRIVFFNDHFFGHGARVFLRNIIKARASRAFQFDFNGCRLSPLCLSQKRACSKRHL
jgi:hypothetical protein